MGGRTGPFALSCSRGTERASFVVKGMGLPEVTPRSLFCEAFGNLLAREIGIATPAPVLVRIGRDLSAAMRPTSAAVGLDAGIAVGTELLVGTAQAPSGTLPPHAVADAALVYAFDLVVQNPDRRERNANCFLRGARVVAFDFEACFSFLLAILPDPEPWVLSKLRLGPRHIFRAGLREAAAGRDGVSWTPFLSAFGGLADVRIRRMIREVPKDWHGDWADRVRLHLKEIAKHSSTLELELQRSLA